MSGSTGAAARIVRLSPMPASHSSASVARVRPLDSRTGAGVTRSAPSMRGERPYGSISLGAAALFQACGGVMNECRVDHLVHRDRRRVVETAVLHVLTLLAADAVLVFGDI